MVGCSGSGRDVDGERWWLCCAAASDVMRLMMISKMIVILIARVLVVGHDHRYRLVQELDSYAVELCQVAGSVKLSQPVPPIIRSLSPCTGELGGLFPKTGRLLPLLLLVFKFPDSAQSLLLVGSCCLPKLETHGHEPLVVSPRCRPFPLLS